MIISSHEEWLIFWYTCDLINIDTHVRIIVVLKMNISDGMYIVINEKNEIGYYIGFHICCCCCKMDIQKFFVGKMYHKIRDN